jgi:type I restriction enzyme S subunit
MGDDRQYPYVRMDAITCDGRLRLDPIKRINATPQEVKEFSLTEGDFLFNTRNSRELVGKTALFRSTGTYLFNNNILRIRFAKSVDPAFMSYVFRTRHIQKQLDGIKSGTTSVYAIYYKNLQGVRVPLPPLAEQKRIAGILDAADALRAKRREALARLDTLLQATFLDLFGDPVTNPKGWKTTELGELIEKGDTINYGVVQPGDDYANGHPLVRVADLDGGELSTASIKLIDPAIERKYKRSRLNGRELLVSCVGSIGTVCKVPLSAKGFNVARAVARVPLVDSIERDFMLHCLRTTAVQRHFQKETRTVSQPTLNIAVIKTAPVIQPPMALQSRFARIAEVVEGQKVQQRGHLAELDTLFASLQSRAFRGDLNAR